MASTTEIPMPEPTVPNKPFSSFKLLAFDIYGTLIDWESGIFQHLEPLTSHLDTKSPHYERYNSKAPNLKPDLLQLYDEFQMKIQREDPEMLYSEVLKRSYLLLAQHFGIGDTQGFSIEEQATTLGSSIGSWPAFSDTVDAMVRLSKYFKLVPLSNVDRASFSKSRAGPLEGKIDFWRVYTAQDIGSYKPDVRNFEYLLRQADEDDRSEGGKGIKKEEVCIVAQSLLHDHRPAKKVGLNSAWINRKDAGMGVSDGGKETHEKGEVGYGWRYPDLKALADEVEQQISK